MAALAVAILMASSPAMGAAPAVKLAPPYHHSRLLASFQAGTTCGTAHGKLFDWDHSTGALTGSSRATVKSCAPTLVGSPNSNSYEWGLVSFPLKAHSSSVYNASMTWDFALKTAVRATTPACPAAVNFTGGWEYVYCDATAKVEMDVGLQIIDTTHPRVVSPGYAEWGFDNYSQSDVSNYCSLGSCGSTNVSSTCTAANSTFVNQGYDSEVGCLPLGTASGKKSLWIDTSDWSSAYGGANITLTPSDAYIVVASFELTAQASADYYVLGFNGSSAFQYSYTYPGSCQASISALGAGSGLSITSVRETPGD